MLTIIVPIYNKKIDSLITFQLIDYVKEKTVFVDNSTLKEIKEYNVKYKAYHNDVNYIDNEGNKGLAKAYNKAIKENLEDENNYFMFIDQDTNLPLSYFTKAKEEIINNPNEKIFAPFIMSKKGTLSPVILKDYFKIIPLSSLSITEEYVLPINTASIVSKDIFKEEIYFDEDYFVDLVDFSFYRTCLLKGYKLHIIPYVLMQCFSREEKASKEARLFRFNDYCNAMYRFASGYEEKGSKYTSNKLRKSATRYSAKYLSLSFIKAYKKAKSNDTNH